MQEIILEEKENSENTKKKMTINKISIKNFKKIYKIDIDLGMVNYIVGGNSSGKSSVLQAIHMAISCAKLSIERKEQVIPESELRYSPTSEFVLLGHTGPYENKADGSRGKVEFFGESIDKTQASYRVEIYKGRNYGNIGVERKGVHQGFGQEISDPKSLFSVYVPGLSGIPHREEYKNYAAVFLKAAGGDANLVFRNIIRILHSENKLDDVNDLLAELIGPCEIEVNHNEDNNLYVDVKFSQQNGKKIPIDLVGTGILQILQIVSYVALFEPKLLLIDEPDSHLHPSRQSLLSHSFARISERYNSTIIVSTHSRHMVASAPEGAKIIWMKDGKVESNDCKDLAAILMDLGALDQLDSLGADYIICTEDKGKEALKKCIDEMKLSDKVKIISYNGINNATSSVAIKAMADLFERKPKIIIHRDRDFLNDDEINKWGEEYLKRDMTIFSPLFSDIESYYCSPQHVSVTYELNIEESKKIIREILEENKRSLREKFRSKRQEVNMKLWKDGGGPDTNKLWPDGEIGEFNQALGKELIKLLNQKMQPNRKNLYSKVPELLKAELRETLINSGCKFE
jgi:AAA15 family ATPase/GTPase